MELRQLRHFLCVAETGSFSKAAVRLSLTQPVLSREVRMLEEEFGEQLFYRNGRGVVLSTAGELLAGHARDMVGISDQLKAEMSARRDTPSGKVVIALHWLGADGAVGAALPRGLPWDFTARRGGLQRPCAGMALQRANRHRYRLQRI